MLLILDFFIRVVRMLCFTEGPHNCTLLIVFLNKAVHCGVLCIAVAVP